GGAVPAGVTARAVRRGQMSAPAMPEAGWDTAAEPPARAARRPRRAVVEDSDLKERFPPRPVPAVWPAAPPSPHQPLSPLLAPAGRHRRHRHQGTQTTRADPAAGLA